MGSIDGRKLPGLRASKSTFAFSKALDESELYAGLVFHEPPAVPAARNGLQHGVGFNGGAHMMTCQSIHGVKT